MNIHFYFFLSFQFMFSQKDSLEKESSNLQESLCAQYANCMDVNRPFAVYRFLMSQMIREFFEDAKEELLKLQGKNQNFRALNDEFYKHFRNIMKEMMLINNLIEAEMPCSQVNNPLLRNGEFKMAPLFAGNGFLTVAVQDRFDSVCCL